MNRISFLPLLLVAITASTSVAGTGTGFAINPDTLITNEHVVSGCKLVTVESSDGNRVGAVINAETLLDLAIIRVPGLSSKNVALIRKDAARIGEDAFVFGFPLAGTLSDEGNFTNGVVSASKGLGNSANLFQFTSPIQPGSSGGPVLDKSGNLIGIVVAKLDSVISLKRTGDIPQNVNFAIKAEVLLNYLNRHVPGIKSLSRAPEGKRSSQDLAKLGRAISHKIICNPQTSMKEEIVNQQPNIDSTEKPEGSSKREENGARESTTKPAESPKGSQAAKLDKRFSCPGPQYPPQALRNGEQGTTVLRFLITEHGRIQRSFVSSSSGFDSLDNAALYALSRCTFQPELKDGKPVEGWAVIRYVWKIK